MPAERSTAADHAQHRRKAGCTAPRAPCRQQLTAGPGTATASRVARTTVDAAQSDTGGLRAVIEIPGFAAGHHTDPPLAGCRPAPFSLRVRSHRDLSVFGVPQGRGARGEG